MIASGLSRQPEVAGSGRIPDENPTYQAESTEHTSDETVASSSCHFPTGTRRRNSSKKFIKKIRGPASAGPPEIRRASMRQFLATRWEIINSIETDVRELFFGPQPLVFFHSEQISFRCVCRHHDLIVLIAEEYVVSVARAYRLYGTALRDLPKTAVVLKRPYIPPG